MAYLCSPLTEQRRLPLRDRFQLDLHYMTTKWAVVVLPASYFGLRRYEPPINDYHPWIVCAVSEHYIYISETRF